MVFARIREHAGTAIFLGEQAEIKNLVCEQRAVQRVQLASREHFLYFPLAAIHMEILFLKKTIKQTKKKRKCFKKTMLYSSLSSKRSVETLF